MMTCTPSANQAVTGEPADVRSPMKTLCVYVRVRRRCLLPVSPSACCSQQSARCVQFLVHLNVQLSDILAKANLLKMLGTRWNDVFCTRGVIMWHYVNITNCGVCSNVKFAAFVWLQEQLVMSKTLNISKKQK